MIEVKRPRLLDSNLAETAVLKPLGLQIALQTPGVSTATLTLSPNDPEPDVHSWIELYNQNGSVGIFRVTSPATDYAQQTTLTLRHGIDSFADSVLSAQEDFEGTPTELLTRMIAAQTVKINGVSPWSLGTCAATNTIKMSLNYNRLSELLQNLEEQLEGYYFEYDQSVFPWVINVKAAPSDVDGEFRLNRNVMTISRTLSDNDLCTQLILSINSKVTNDDVTTNKQYIKTYNNTAAQAIYGIVQKTADIDTADNLVTTTEQPVPSTPEADAWAARFMSDHSAPTVQIQMTAKELSRITGDTWDETKLGHICRVSLPTYNQIFTERVVNVTYPDALGQPDVVNVSLANQLPKFSSSIAQLRAETARLGRSGRGGARAAASADQLEVWSQHVQYYGEALDGTGVLTLYESGIDMNPLGGVTIYSLEEGVQSLYSGIQVNTNEISSVVQKTGINSLGQSETLYSKITQNATAITLKVSKGDVSTQLAVECGNVTISGGNLVVSGYVTSDGLATEIANLNLVNVTDLVASGSISGDSVTADYLEVEGSAEIGGDVSAQTGYFDSIDLNGSTFTNVIVSASVSQDGKTLTLTPLTGNAINFSKPGQGVITAITKSGQTWKPAMAGTTHGGYEVGVYASGTDVGTYSSTIDVDAASAWSAGWAEGYDDGEADGEAKFTQATVTLQGASAGTIYKRKTSGSIRVTSQTIYPRGTVHYYQRHTASETPTGAWYTRHTSNPGGTYNTEYDNSASSITAYVPSSTGTYYYLGDGSVDNLYQAGTTDTTTYYTKSST